MKTKYLQLPTIKIAYTESGSGRNLILLHGNSENKSIFKKHQLHWFKNFHTYALDSRGHGQSVSIDSQYSIEQYSEDVIGFCRAMGITKTAVVGFSDGGNICLFLARKHPGIFEKIVTIAPNYLVSGTTDKALRSMQKIHSMFLFLRKIHCLPKRKLMRWELMLKDIGITDGELSQIHADMLLLYAENDTIKEEHLLKIVHLIPHCKVKKIAGSTHMNVYKNGEAIAAMLQYLATLLPPIR